MLLDFVGQLGRKFKLTIIPDGLIGFDNNGIALA